MIKVAMRPLINLLLGLVLTAATLCPSAAVAHFAEAVRPALRPLDVSLITNQEYLSPTKILLTPASAHTR